MSQLKCITTSENGISLAIYVKPNSRKRSLTYDSTEPFVRVTLKSPPDKGKANKELLKFLSNFFGISNANIRIISGLTSRDKVVLLSDIDVHQIEAKLAINKNK